MQPAAPVVSVRPRRAFSPSAILAALLSAAVLFVAIGVAAPTQALAATAMVTTCDGATLRTAPRTSAPAKTSVPVKTRLTVSAKVNGGSWRISCAGRTLTGSTWYRISHVGSSSVSSRYGVSSLYIATGLAKAATTTTTTTYAAACSTNLRTSASTAARVLRTVSTGTKVSVNASVSGSSYRATCGGQTVSSSKWYRITAINGKSVKSLYGVTYLYGAAALFKTVSAPAPTPPATTTLYAACDDVNVRTAATTDGTLRTTLDAGSAVVSNGTVQGTSWTVNCGGKTLSGTDWHRIVSVEGRSTSSAYNVAQLYAAAGLFTTTPPSSTPAPAPDPAAVTEGIDVSHWQGTVNWAQVAAAGKDFVYLKASEHTAYVDPTYATNRAGARANGLRVGAYHFARPDATPGDAIAEADHFVRTAAVARGDLLPVLDIEVTGGLSPADLRTWSATFLARVHERTGVRAVIYASPTFWANQLGNSTWFAANGYRLWTAHWTTGSTPAVPASNWGGTGWTFWQYSATGRVAGIAGYVDLNRFRGTDFSNVLVP